MKSELLVNSFFEFLFFKKLKNQEHQFSTQRCHLLFPHKHWYKDFGIRVKKIEQKLMGLIRRTRIVMFPQNDVVWGCCTKSTKTVSRVWVPWWKVCVETEKYRTVYVRKKIEYLKNQGERKKECLCEFMYDSLFSMRFCRVFVTLQLLSPTYHW